MNFSHSSAVFPAVCGCGTFLSARPGWGGGLRGICPKETVSVLPPPPPPRLQLKEKVAMGAQTGL